MEYKRRKIFWLVFGLSVLALIGWFLAGPLLALRKIQDDSSSSSLLGFLGKINEGQLKGEKEGRINILLLGVGGKNHPGGTLADTIQVVSINPKDKKVAVMSIPRDLQVKIPGVGLNKINYAHAYGEVQTKTTGGGPSLLKQVVRDVTAQEMHYYVRLDFDGFTKLVDALGGIDVYVDKAINDPFYPAADMVKYDPFRISAGEHHLDGKTTLKYVRSRETTSDFDRSKRQQQVMIALKEKALSLNILANPRKVNEIAAILGQHLKTDFATWEITRALEMAARDIQSASLITRVLSIGPGEPLVPQNNGGYYLVPRTGNFKEIQQIAKNIFDEGAIKSEQAKIELVNASGETKTLNEVVTILKNLGFTVTSSRSATTTVDHTVLYDYSSGSKPQTAKMLGEQFDVQAVAKVRPSGSSIDFSIVIGKDYRS